MSNELSCLDFLQKKTDIPISINSLHKFNILYIDIYHGGHHLSYTKNIIDRLIDNNCVVDVLTKDIASTTPSYKEYLDVLKDRANIYEIFRDSSSFFLPECIRTWISLNKAFKELINSNNIKYDAIFLPNVSGLYQSMGFLGSPFGTNKIIGILISIRFHLRRVGIADGHYVKDVVNESLFFRFLSNSNLARIITIDPELLNDKQVKAQKSSSKIKFRPHPYSVKNIYLKNSTRTKFAIDEKKFIVLVFGSLTRRKAIDSLIAAAADSRLNNSVRVIIAGVADQCVHNTLESDSAKYLRDNDLLREELRFISEDEEAMLFAAADIVWVAYRDFYDTSGVLLTAYLNSKPVIGCDVGYISNSVKKDCTGLVVNPDSHEDVVSALLCLTSSKQISYEYGKNGQSCVKSRDPDSFFKSIVDETFDALFEN